MLYERLQEAGESKVNAMHQEKQSDYVNTLGRMRKLGAQEIATRPDLHPSLRAVQRRQQEEILKREADKEPNAFTPKAAANSVAGSPIPSFMTTRVCLRLIQLNQQEHWLYFAVVILGGLPHQFPTAASGFSGTK